MPTTITRLAILEALQARLQTIHSAGQFYSELGNNVFLMRERIYDTKELPAANIRRISNTFDDLTNRSTGDKSYQTLQVDVDLIFTPGASIETLIEQGIADVYKAVGSDPTLGGLATDIVPIKDEIIYEEAQPLEVVVAGATVSLNIFYTTKRFKESMT